MKLLVFFLMMATVNGQAQVSPLSTIAQIQLVQDNKLEISLEDLPEEVYAALEESDYATWTVSKVYQIEAPDETTYELHLFQDEVSVVLVADSEGNLKPKIEG